METSNNKHDNLTKIRKLLLSGAKITVLSVLKIVKTIEARHYLSILRKEGLAIQDEWQTDGVKRWKCWWINV